MNNADDWTWERGSGDSEKEWIWQNHGLDCRPHSYTSALCRGSIKAVVTLWYLAYYLPCHLNLILLDHIEVRTFAKEIILKKYPISLFPYPLRLYSLLHLFNFSFLMFVVSIQTCDLVFVLILYPLILRNLIVLRFSFFWRFLRVFYVDNYVIWKWTVLFLPFQLVCIYLFIILA